MLPQKCQDTTSISCHHLLCHRPRRTFLLPCASMRGTKLLMKPRQGQHDAAARSIASHAHASSPGTSHVRWTCRSPMPSLAQGIPKQHGTSRPCEALRRVSFHASMQDTAGDIFLHARSGFFLSSRCCHCFTLLRDGRKNTLQRMGAEVMVAAISRRPAFKFLCSAARPSISSITAAK